MYLLIDFYWQLFCYIQVELVWCRGSGNGLPREGPGYDSGVKPSFTSFARDSKCRWDEKPNHPAKPSLLFQVQCNCFQLQLWWMRWFNHLVNTHMLGHTEEGT